MNLGTLAQKINAHLEGDATLEVTRISPLNEAKEGDLTFVLEKKFIADANQSRASAFVTLEYIPGLCNQLIAQNPKRALTETILCFFPSPQSFKSEPGISSRADVHPTAQIGQNVRIGAFAVVGAYTIIGDDTQILPHVVIGQKCTLGKNCIIYPHVTLYDQVQLGDYVHIHAGTVIGADGFGYFLDQNIWNPVPQVGTVEIKDHVEIGSNTSIDRGCLGATYIGEGTKLDNLVQISHNAHLGPHCLIAGQSGVLGSAHLEHHVVVAGQSGIGHVHVGAGTQVAARSAVASKCPPQSILSGFPAWNHMDELKKEAFVRKLYKQSRTKKDNK